MVFVNTGAVTNFASLIWATDFQNSGIFFARSGSIELRQSQSAILRNGAFIAPAGDIFISTGSLVISNHLLQAGGVLTIAGTNFMDDGSLAGGGLVNVSNVNFWSGNGFNLLTTPAQGSLLGTTISNYANPFQRVFIRSAAVDKGCNQAGFVANNAIGRLILSGSTNSLFEFEAVGGFNALYVDTLELTDFTASYLVGTNFAGLLVDPGMKVYFRQATANGVPISAQLNGQNNNAFCWVTGAPSSGGGNTNTPPGGGSGGGGGGSSNVVSTVPTLDLPPATGSDEVLPNGFVLAKGSYNGLFYDTNGLAAPSSGYFTAKTTEKGAFTGKLLIGGRSYVVSGQFDAAGNVTRTIARPGASPLTLQLHLDLSGGDQIRGQVSSGNWAAQMVADRLLATPSKRVSTSGNYTLVIPGETEEAKGPAGAGIGTVKVNQGGNVVWSGTMADGTKVTQSSALSKQGLWPLYSPLYGGGGAVVSWIEFANQPDSDLGGPLIWIKPAGAHKYYPQGFTNELMSTGSSYRAPASGARALNMTEGSLVLSGGGLAQPLVSGLTLGANNRVTPAAGSKLMLSLSPTTGLFKGSAFNPDTGKTIPFQGVLFKKANIGIGYFLGADQSGEIYLSPAP